MEFTAVTAQLAGVFASEATVMALPSALSSVVAAPPDRARRDLLRGWRLYVAQIPADAADSICMLAALGVLERCLERLRRDHLERACRQRSADVPAGVPLGAAARLLVEWLRIHPDSAGEPLPRLVAAALGNGYSGVRPRLSK